jgi:uncharacterized protein
MQRRGAVVSLTPTDVASHLACPHLTQLGWALVEGRLRVSLPEDPRCDARARRGAAHEQGYVESLASRRLSIQDLRITNDPAATLTAMQNGRDAIVQAPLADGRFTGRVPIGQLCTRSASRPTIVIYHVRQRFHLEADDEGPRRARL